nr:hypothetical protein [Porcine redondovirus 1]
MERVRRLRATSGLGELLKTTPSRERSNELRGSISILQEKVLRIKLNTLRCPSLLNYLFMILLDFLQWLFQDLIPTCMIPSVIRYVVLLKVNLVLIGLDMVLYYLKNTLMLLLHMLWELQVILILLICMLLILYYLLLLVVVRCNYMQHFTKSLNTLVSKFLGIHWRNHLLQLLHHQ